MALGIGWWVIAAAAHPGEEIGPQVSIPPQLVNMRGRHDEAVSHDDIYIAVLLKMLGDRAKIALETVPSSP